MKKTVLKLDLHDDKDKRKAIKAVAALSGIDSISIDMKEQKMTVSGTADPIVIVKKLRKCRKADIVTVGEPQKEEKKDNPKVDQIAYYHYPPYIPNQYYYAENPPNTCIII